MFPRSATHSVFSGRISDLKLPCQIRNRHPLIKEASHTLYSLFGKISYPIFTSTCPAFIHHILYILGICPQKQMFRVHTTSVVASMTHQHVFRYVSHMNCVRKSVRPPKLTMAGKYSIPFVTLSRNPRPTFILTHLHSIAVKRFLQVGIACKPGRVDLRRMSSNVIRWLSFYKTKPFVSATVNIRFLTAPALAKTKRYIHCASPYKVKGISDISSIRIFLKYANGGVLFAFY